MALNREKLYPWQALLRAKFIGSGRVMELIKHFGSIEAALHAPAYAIAEIRGFSTEIGNSIRKAANGEFDQQIEREFNWCDKHGINMVLSIDPEYPVQLKNIPAPPCILHVRGKIRIEDILSFAIVGSRTASDTGRRLTNQIACELAEAGLTIVSGLAWGVDAAAHKGALKCKYGRTIAVMGSGHKCIYPREHTNLADQICKRGALITELFYDSSPQGRNFPPRNRIISGLSLGVLIAEASQRSGALITADYALEQGREILALPGDLERNLSQGGNRLIRDSKARLVTTAEEILDELQDKITFYKNELEGKIPRVDLSLFPDTIAPSVTTSAALTQAVKEKNEQEKQEATENKPSDSPPVEVPEKQSTKPLPPMSSDEEQLLAKLTPEPKHIDAINRELDWPASRVSSALGMLELKGIIERESGMRFCLKNN